MPPLALTSRLTCPECGHVSVETMPTDACRFFHRCAGCGTLLRPRPGDCCVYCSYGDAPCSPMQAAPVADACGTLPEETYPAGQPCAEVAGNCGTMPGTIGNRSGLHRSARGASPDTRADRWSPATSCRSPPRRGRSSWPGASSSR